MPDWISVRTPESARVRTSRAPFDVAQTNQLVRAARSVQGGPSRSLVEPRFSVYVILLQYSDDAFGLYVGMTGLTPDDRYLNHKAGYKSSRAARAYGTGLLPALYRHLNPLDWEPARQAEKDLAQALAATGVTVVQN